MIEEYDDEVYLDYRDPVQLELFPKEISKPVKWSIVNSKGKSIIKFDPPIGLMSGDTVEFKFKITFSEAYG